MVLPQMPRRIAIADDSPAFLAAAANYVAGLPGYVLAGTASSAIDAQRLVESATPDVLLLDLGLSPSRGLSAIQRIKAAPRAPAVIGLALFYSEEIAAQAKAAGAQALVGKEAFVTGLDKALEGLFPPRRG